ncbi:hypothetical protein [Micromonospora tarensis]|uniref:Uncharacterized protein n=1 Tax=Micromonospora tarensis TaxID=2806100 RepID=A0ABS1YCD6_9ACTN|nr:hypothetical protein [Micromonospora tarensis]MBM0275081.1 hypothetical protein [Micromonospora tarensis]
MTPALLAATSDPDRGWGGPIALLIAIVVFLTVIGIQEYINPENPSPTGDQGSGVTANPKVNSVSDTDDTEPDTSWWGRIRDVGGRRVRVVDEPVDDELDLDLDDEDEPETVEKAVARMVGERQSYMEIVRHLMTVHRVSESTAKRRIREHHEAV